LICISKHRRSCSGTVHLPASKSISNRLLILQHAYGNNLSIRNLSDSDDTILLSSLLDLIRQYQKKEDNSLLRLDARNAGTVMRFLLPMLSVTRGHFMLTGDERMKQRPIAGLVEAMRETGAEIDYLEEIGYPPLLIRGRALRPGRIKIDASVSSQFVTALLLLAPALEEGLTIELMGVKASWPYVKMTTGILTNLGIQVIAQEDAIRVFHKKQLKIGIEVESDWSSAAFFYCILSLADKGEIFMKGLRKTGLQGDQQVITFFRQLGIATVEEQDGVLIRKDGPAAEDFYADFTGHPDLSLPVILACAVKGVNGQFTGLDRLKIKESDRLEALSDGLAKTGIILKEEFPGSWRLSGQLIKPSDLLLDDRNDHRVAMTFASLAMAGFTVHLEHPDAVKKSFPGFWDQISSLGFKCDFSC
jgi:3-phosphoshikimate 1-carboxyvinyltransferase